MDKTLNSKITLRDEDMLLVIPPPFFTKMPSIGVAYLATYLKHKGFKVSVFDMSLRIYNNAPAPTKRFWAMDCTNDFFVKEISDKLLHNFKQEIDDFVDAFLSTNTKIIGFSVNLISIFLSNEIARLIKARDPSRFIIFGGPATFFKHPRELIDPGFVDLFVIGEGEAVTPLILQRALKNKHIKNGAGILLGRDFRRVNGIPAVPLSDIRQIPFPTFSEFELAEYNQGNDYKPLPLLTSRGCIRKCSYCIDHIMWPKFRFRDPEYIFKEIEYHMLNNNTKAFEFNDLTCNGNLKQLSAICDLIIASGYKFDWVSYAIVRREMDSDLLLRMKKAGCHTLIFGIESASERILKLMGKNFTAKDAAELIRRAHEAGICTNMNIIVGFPGETEEDFNLTAEFIESNRANIDEITNVSGCTLFPDAELGRKKEKFGIYSRKDQDPMLFVDANGVDLECRNKRVEKMLKIVNELNITKAIINKPTLNPEVKAALENEKYK